MAKPGMEIHGIEKLQWQIGQITKQFTEGVNPSLRMMGLFFQRKSMAIVPIDTGNLRGSAFTRSSGTGMDTVVFVGYTAAYAVYVHEDPDARHRPGKEYKFLETPLRRYRREGVQLFVRHLKARRKPV